MTATQSRASPVLPAPAATRSVTDHIESSVEAVGADRVLAEIRQSCFIIYVTIKAWRGQYLIRQGHTTIDGRAVDDQLATKGQWKLIPQAWHRQLQPFESKTRAAIYKVGVPFRDGVYIVPKGRAKTLIDEIKALRVDYKRKVIEFQREWPDHVRSLEHKITHDVGPDQWLAVSKLLPDARKLPELFDIEIGLWPIHAEGGGLPIECYDDIEQAAATLDAVARVGERLALMSEQPHTGILYEDAQLVTQLIAKVRTAWARVKRSSGKLIEEHADEWLEEAQAVTNRMVASAVESMVSEPIREFAEQIDNLQRLTETQTVRTGTLDALRRAYQKLQGFSFLLPSELLTRLQSIDLRVGGADPQMMNTQSVAGARLNETLKGLRTELTSELGQLNAFGQFARHLDI